MFGRSAASKLLDNRGKPHQTCAFVPFVMHLCSNFALHISSSEFVEAIFSEVSKRGWREGVGD